VSAQVRLEREGPIGWLIFDHPERRNAIHRAMWEVIPERVATLDADDSVRVIVMRGAGDVAFVAGADISEFEQSRIGRARATTTSSQSAPSSRWATRRSRSLP
jgi:enoyl-CoA hydratase